MASESGDRYLVQRFVELTVAAPREPVTVLGLARGHLNGGGTTKPGVGGFVAAPAWV